jgi:hypothetical protein
MQRTWISWTLLAAAIVLAGPAAAKAKPVITVAEADLTNPLSPVVDIGGDGFGSSPAVFLGEDLGGLVELTVLASSDEAITAELPTGLAAATYLLVVEAGNGASKIATMDFTLGAVGPQGPQGPIGPAGPAGPQGDAGDEGAPQSKADLYTRQNGADCGPGSPCFVAVFCDDANDIGFYGACLNPAGKEVYYNSFLMTSNDPADPGTARWACSGRNFEATETVEVRARVTCISVP